MHLIRANESHIPQIRNIAHRNFDEVLSKVHSSEIVMKCKAGHSIENLTAYLSWKKVYVMLDHDMVVGTGSLANFGTAEQPKWSVSNLYVLPENHGMGIGRQIIQQLIHDARHEAAKTLHVPSSRNAVGFYQRMGFVIDPRDLAERAQNTAAIIEGIRSRLSGSDSEDISQLEALERESAARFDAAYRAEVEQPVYDVNQQMEQAKMEIATERRKVENEAGTLQGMSDTIVSAEASKASGELRRSAQEYANMESKADSIMATKLSEAQGHLQRIQNSLRK